MTTGVKPQPNPAQPVRQTGFGVILRALRVWVPRRIVPRLAALSVIRIRAKQSQSWADWGVWTAMGHPLRAAGPGAVVQTNPISGYAAWGEGNCAKQTQFRPWRPSGAPLFQYSTIPAFQSDAGCTNEAKLRQDGISGEQIREAYHAKQTQFLRRGLWITGSRRTCGRKARSGPARASCTNKPNSRDHADPEIDAPARRMSRLSWRSS